MRTKVDLSLDIVHELPLAIGPQALATQIEQSVTGWELMGQRDPKLSIRATLTEPVLDGAESILVVQALRERVARHRKLTDTLSADTPNVEHHRTHLRELAEVYRQAANKLEDARNAR